MTTKGDTHMSDSVIHPPDAAQPAVSDDEKAAAAAEQAKTHDHKGAEKFVLFTGPRTAAANANELKKRQPRLGEASQAEISVAQWAQVGIESPRGHVWALGNNWRIPVAQFSDAQLDYLLNHSTRFEIVDAHSKKVSR